MSISATIVTHLTKMCRFIGSLFCLHELCTARSTPLPQSLVSLFAADVIAASSQPCTATSATHIMAQLTGPTSIWAGSSRGVQTLRHKREAAATVSGPCLWRMLLNVPPCRLCLVWSRGRPPQPSGGPLPGTIPGSSEEASPENRTISVVNKWVNKCGVYSNTHPPPCRPHPAPLQVISRKGCANE